MTSMDTVDWSHRTWTLRRPGVKSRVAFTSQDIELVLEQLVDSVIADYWEVQCMHGIHYLGQAELGASAAPNHKGVVMLVLIDKARKVIELQEHGLHPFVMLIAVVLYQPHWCLALSTT
jgi:hypothetical protein